MYFRPTDAQSTKLFVEARFDELRSGRRAWRRRTPRSSN